MSWVFVAYPKATIEESVMMLASTWGWESVHQNDIWIINDSIINPLMCSQVDIWDNQLLQVDNWKIISLWTTIEKKYFYSLLINSCVTWFVSIIYIKCNYNPCFCTHERLSMQHFNAVNLRQLIQKSLCTLSTSYFN
jgi:hypothetical protein